MSKIERIRRALAAARIAIKGTKIEDEAFQFVDRGDRINMYYPLTDYLNKRRFTASVDENTKLTAALDAVINAIEK